MNRLLAISLVLATCSVQAQSVQVPHSFESGTPALASEVNANFDALVGAVNANHAAISGLTSGTPQQIGTLQILHANYDGESLPVFGFEWSTAFNVPQGGGVAAPQFGPLVVLKPVDAYTPTLFRDHIGGQSFLDITVALTSADGVTASYFAANLVISEFETITTSGGLMFDRLSFSNYDLVQITVTDPATNTETVACWNVSTHSDC